MEVPQAADGRCVRRPAELKGEDDPANLGVTTRIQCGQMAEHVVVRYQASGKFSTQCVEVAGRPRKYNLKLLPRRASLAAGRPRD